MHSSILLATNAAEGLSTGSLARQEWRKCKPGLEEWTAGRIWGDISSVRSALQMAEADPAPTERKPHTS